MKQFVVQLRLVPSSTESQQTCTTTDRTSEADSSNVWAHVQICASILAFIDVKICAELFAKLNIAVVLRIVALLNVQVRALGFASEQTLSICALMSAGTPTAKWQLHLFLLL